ncbi:hypothetical protein [Variovorax sp. PAMC 28711]|uniref:hypothetical protein n=1 Tax=Variovorax sp. PAMC 28711 TaxID=1795631 RepID=UPI00078CD21E|nr:hypothetical protein [Variovorax sp. PAMC 28711]AMM25720.1 hypothetical protein AX767_16155 [Variovorax sp. PAMC 28711]
MPTEPDVEYELYKLANARHDSLTAPAAGAPASSSPSGWYELLRFGRNLGRGPAATDKDPLPSNAAHWRRIADANGQKVWADLNASGSFKFSDADFLPAMGWNCIQDDTSPNDQRCDSANLKNLIRDPDATNTRRMETSELARRIGDEAVKQKLRRAICKFPSEWDRASVKARYGFVQDFEGFKKAPEAWPNLQKHLEALSFDNLPQGFKDADWRVHPREFIGMMRRCLWLSVNEAIQMFPRSALRKTGATTWANETVNPALRRLGENLMRLNQTTRKYCIDTPRRLAAFYGNAMQETQWFAVLAENGGTSTRYAPWYGRGFLQLTWPANYIRYAKFRGLTVGAQLESQLAAAQKTADTTRSNVALRGLDASVAPDLVALRQSAETSNNYVASDSAGAYWAWSEASRSADQSAAFMRVSLATSTGPIAYYTHSGFGDVAATVNVGHPATNYAAIYGVQARFQGYVAAVMVLLDREQFPDVRGQLKDEPEGWIRRTP